jgi:hypothetical protein
MENFYSLEQKIVEFKYSMQITSSDSLELAKLVLKFTQDVIIFPDYNTPHSAQCYYYALMSVLKKISDKKDKKNYKLKLNGSEYHALKGVLESYHTKLLGEPDHAYTWSLTHNLLEQMT